MNPAADQEVRSRIATQLSLQGKTPDILDTPAGMWMLDPAKNPDAVPYPTKVDHALKSFLQGQIGASGGSPSILNDVKVYFSYAYEHLRNKARNAIQEARIKAEGRRA